MKRDVEPELLDALPADDPAAIISRRDLKRLNTWMGNAATMVGGLRSALQGRAARQIVELGAGDGSFLLCVARQAARNWPGTSVTLLDKQSIVPAGTRKAFERLGWSAETSKADVFNWLSQPRVQPFEVVVANLFLHHFSESQLAELFRAIAQRAQVFVAVEPRRSACVLVFSRLVGLIGCNYVTRHDAPVSVRAGFAGHELSRLWPSHGGWSLEERPAGLFSHLFLAQRKEQACIS